MQHFIQDLLIGHDIAQAVAAQHKIASFFHFPGKQIGVQHRLRPQRSGDQILMRMAPCLIRGQISPLHQILHQRVISGHLGDGFRCDVINAAVPFVQNRRVGCVKQDGHHGGTHAEAVVVCGGTVVHRFIGMRGSRFQHVLSIQHTCIPKLRKQFLKRLHCHGAGHLASAGASHTVTDHRQKLMIGQGMDGKSVLILFPYHSAVGDSP